MKSSLSVSPLPIPSFHPVEEQFFFFLTLFIFFFLLNNMS